LQSLRIRRHRNLFPRRRRPDVPDAAAFARMSYRAGRSDQACETEFRSAAAKRLSEFLSGANQTSKGITCSRTGKAFLGNSRFGGRVSLCPAEANQTRNVARC